MSYVCFLLKFIFIGLLLFLFLLLLLSSFNFFLIVLLDQLKHVILSCDPFKILSEFNFFLIVYLLKSSLLHFLSLFLDQLLLLSSMILIAI